MLDWTIPCTVSWGRGVLVEAGLVGVGDAPRLDLAANPAAHVEVAVVRGLPQVRRAAPFPGARDLRIGEGPILPHPEHPERVAAVTDRVGVGRIGLEGPAHGQRDRLTVQLLDDLPGLAVPPEEGAREGLA